MKTLAWLPAVILLSASASNAQAPAAAAATQQPLAATERLRLMPRLERGLVLRYQVDSTILSEGRSSGLVEDPQAPSRMEFTTASIMRMEVLDASASPECAMPPSAEKKPAAQAAGLPCTRMRITFEKASGTMSGDPTNAARQAVEETYRKIEGRSIEFTLDARGGIVDVKGLQEIFPNQEGASAVRDWLSQIAGGAGRLGGPQEGIVPGQTWTAERGVGADAPLLGLSYRSVSTYLRNEGCPTGMPAGTAESCAVIQTHLEILQMKLDDLTPPGLRSRGMRVSGNVTGSGDSLSYISLRSGWIVSVSQSHSQLMDVTFSSDATGTPLRHTGRVNSKMSLKLLPGDQAK